MESPVEIRYAGVVIGRAQEVRSPEGDPSAFFLVVREPMPVGSVLHLRSGDRETPARVVHTVESSDPAACGVQVRLIGESEEVATEWIPPPPPVADKARPAEEPLKTAMPVIDVDMSGLQAASAIAAQTRLKRAPATAQPNVEQIGFSFAAVAEGELAQALAATAPSQPPAVAAPIESAVPEAIPDAVASSATLPREAAPEAAAVAASAESPASDPPANADAEAQGGSAVSTEDQPPAEDLPPARPISGPSGRRKTKRRR
jgi:hypothetical protein